MGLTFTKVPMRLFISNHMGLNNLYGDKPYGSRTSVQPRQRKKLFSVIAGTPDARGAVRGCTLDLGPYAFLLSGAQIGVVGQLARYLQRAPRRGCMLYSGNLFDRGALRGVDHLNAFGHKMPTASQSGRV